MENFDFNSFIIKEMNVCIDSSLYTFDNEPTTMSGTFLFLNTRTFNSDKTQQIVIMNSDNILYTREYDTDTETFSDWITNSSGAGSITNITSTDGSIDVTNPSGPTVNIKMKNVPVTVTATGILTATANFIKVGTTATTQTLPLGSTVTAFKTYTVKNKNIATTAVIPQGSDQLDGAGTAFNIVGPYNSMGFYWDSEDNMWYSIN